VLGGGAARFLEHGGGHIDADDVSARSGFPRRQERIDARTRTQIENGFSRLHRCERQRIAAAQP
jgi:hypothetical protein